MERQSSVLIGRSRIRTALIGIPLCVSGIALIFWLKPQAGSTIRGLSLLTAAIQALGALGVVLFFIGLQDYLKYKESLRKITPKFLDKESLLKKARKTGQASCVDTAPNPEHVDEWVENATLFLRGSLLDLLEEYPVPPEDFPEVLSAMEDGFRSLLENQNRHREKNDLSLSSSEIVDLAPRIFRRLGKEEAVQKRLETDPGHDRSSRNLSQVQ